MGAFIDLTGQRFGRYFVLSRAEDQVSPSGRHRVMWMCLCDCGNVKIVHGDSLVSGHVVSCGCYKAEIKRAQLTTHGGTVGGKPTRLYKVWDGMKARCYNPKKEYYAIYGGRGIAMCEEWHNSFEAFRDWALSHGYADNLSIDRIDNDGPYCPDNCRWATISEQNNNKSTSHFLTFNGETKTIAQWAEETGFSFHLIYSRISKGMSVEDALLTPRRVKGNGRMEYVPSNLVKQNRKE